MGRYRRSSRREGRGWPAIILTGWLIVVITGALADTAAASEPRRPDLPLATTIPVTPQPNTAPVSDRTEGWAMPPVALRLKGPCGDMIELAVPAGGVMPTRSAATMAPPDTIPAAVSPAMETAWRVSTVKIRPLASGIFLTGGARHGELTALRNAPVSQTAQARIHSLAEIGQGGSSLPEEDEAAPFIALGWKGGAPLVPERARLSALVGLEVNPRLRFQDEALVERAVVDPGALARFGVSVRF